MANVLLGVTGSVAAIHTRALFEELQKAGHAVKVVATQASLYFFDPATIEPLRNEMGSRRNPEVVILDEDEWPGRGEGRLYERGDKVVHIELRRWADLLLVAPLDANTLAKFACGLADNCLTCVWRAWDRARPVVLAPAMNTLMWEHPLTWRHLYQLSEDLDALGGGALEEPCPYVIDEIINWINSHCPRARVVPPVSKRLACDDVGVGGLADRATILAMAAELMRY